MTYQVPIDDIVLALKSAGKFSSRAQEGIYEDIDEETVSAILEEAGRFGSEVLEPLNQLGDREGATHDGDCVITPKGWKEAYQQFKAGGWCALPCETEFGGQGLPSVLSVSVSEVWGSCNLAFGICPLLTQGAIDALTIGGSDALKQKYLPKLVSGEWSGTMNLTEPQAGSDLGGVKTKAVPQSDGSYKITGTKIFISYGEHDLTENIIHLVLARLPDAPEGTRGISLFLVPKFHVDEAGNVGARNDVVCAGIEKKLGIHASPTCVMSFGEKGGATGYLVGEENRGLRTMFIMMNAARLGVGVQGVSVAERATQRAIAYAEERKQGSALGDGSREMSPIIAHPDVRRNLLTMRALTQAARMICIRTASELDRAERATDAKVGAAASHLAALLTPIAKSFSTDVACEVASIGIQVHGGMGFVEETGAAQYLRDARILPIYEGTNGIQAIDLVTRKLPLEGGAIVKAHLQELDSIVEEVSALNRPDLGLTGVRLKEAVEALQGASLFVGQALQSDPGTALASAAPYLRLFGITTGGAYLAKGALDALNDGARAETAASLARFFAENVVTEAPGLEQLVTTGAQSVLEAPLGSA